MFRSKLPFVLMAGDALALLTLSIIGFASHNQTIDWQVLTTFLPFVISWTAIAPWLGVYQEDIASDIRQVWRPGLAALLAAPMTAWLRALWLDRAIPPIFVTALGFTAVLGFLIWRLAWTLISKQTKSYG
jgi:hypothetical protein